MTEKTRQIVDRYEFLEHSLALPEILSDAAKYSSMMKEYNSLGPVVEVIRRVDLGEKQMADAEEMMRGESDPELRQMAQQEYYALREDLAEAERLLSGLTYRYGLDLTPTLRANLERDENETHLAELKALAESLEILRRRLEREGEAPEAYALELERLMAEL